MDLDELRKRIDALDADLVRLLNERTRIVLDIGHVKKNQGEEVYVPAREKAVLDRVSSLNQGPLPKDALQAIYREIMSASLALEHGVNIAYLGPPATFTHQAARQRFGGSVRYAPCETIGEVFGAVEKRATDYGVVPIENSTDGAVTHTLDEFVDTALKICAEIYLPISHNLLAMVPRERIRRLYSKPEVFGQCRRWLHENLPGVELISSSSTARASEQAAKEPETGALASALAGELYGLNILDRDIQDLGGNTTRFLVISKNYGKPTGNDKTSLLFAVKHKVGALYDALSAFKKYGINMTKIESRPSKTKAWEYFFFVDIEGHAEDEHVQKALGELEEHCSLMTVLGAYPKASERDQ
jgi:chorismate mutase / prephenate dehydratase